MVCQTCGLDQVAGARFCGRCGAGLAPMMMAGLPVYAMPQPRKRVSDHLQPLGILWIVFGVYRIVTTVVAAVAFHTLARNGMFGDWPPFLQQLAGGLLPGIALLIGVIGLLTMATGWALLTRRPWARTFAMVMGILALLKVPLGTGLGIYTLWVLAPRASAAEWQGLVEAQPVAGVA